MKLAALPTAEAIEEMSREDRAQLAENLFNDRARIIEYLDDLDVMVEDLNDTIAYDDVDESGEDGFPYNCHDLSDDGDALASCGWGCDEDYGYYGGDEW